MFRPEREKDTTKVPRKQAQEAEAEPDVQEENGAGSLPRGSGTGAEF